MGFLPPVLSAEAVIPAKAGISEGWSPDQCYNLGTLNIKSSIFAFSK